MVLPVDNFEEVKEWIDRNVNEDGYLYPPYVSKWRVDSKTYEPIEEISETKRCAHLYKIPPSHKIFINNFTGAVEEFRNGLGGLILYLLSYLFGNRLQFHGWWVDGRISMSTRSNDFRITKSTICNFISHSLDSVLKWDPHDRNLFLNIIYMESKSPSYEWDWERFITEYMVFDGCFNLAKSLYKIKANSHRKRFDAICDRFNIPYQEKRDIIKKISQLRNDLFHRTLWDGAMPGQSPSEISFMASQYLRKINQRIISALLDYRTPYINTGWWYLGVSSFDPPK